MRGTKMAKRRILPSQEYLQECFEYAPETGLLVWKYRPVSHFQNAWAWKVWTKNFAGKEAGCVHTLKSGYIRREVGLCRTLYIAARIIYKLMANEEPAEVDHRDLNPMNMKWNNLRAATQSSNRMNRRVFAHSASGLKGVNKRTKAYNLTKPYEVNISVRGKRLFVGAYATAKEPQ